MDIRLRHSDILMLPSGEYAVVSGIEEIAQQVELCAKIKKGSFIYNKELGTELYKIDTTSELKEKTAEVCIKEAIMPTEDTEIKVLVFDKLKNGDFYIKFTVENQNKTITSEVTLNADI